MKIAVYDCAAGQQIVRDADAAEEAAIVADHAKTAAEKLKRLPPVDRVAALEMRLAALEAAASVVNK